MLIGLIGNKGSGKDTFANYINKKYDFISYAFADKLKQICKILFELNDEQLNGKLKEDRIDELGVSPRTLFQRIGTDLFRNLLPVIIPELKKFLKNDSIWIKSFEIWYKKKQKNQNIVVTDVRFKNEADIIKKNGGILIKINRFDKSNDNHLSENELETIDYDILILNDSTLNKFYKNIDCIFKKLI